MGLVTRFLVAAVLNAVVPGPGLILLGRPWLGVALAVWFVLGAELAAFGLLIAPATLPHFASLSGAVLAAVAWLLAQALLIGRIRFLRDPNLPRELAILRRLAERGLARGDHKGARTALLIARSIDDSDLATRILWARLLSCSASPRRARRAWLAAARLDADRRFADEIRDELERLQTA